jgi:alpha-D-ribose 1-methylphosphonate 5-phosphate C-P lyase
MHVCSDSDHCQTRQDEAESLGHAAAGVLPS